MPHPQCMFCRPYPNLTISKCTGRGNVCVGPFPGGFKATGALENCIEAQGSISHERRPGSSSFVRGMCAHETQSWPCFRGCFLQRLMGVRKTEAPPKPDLRCNSAMALFTIPESVVSLIHSDTISPFMASCSLQTSREQISLLMMYVRRTLPPSQSHGEKETEKAMRGRTSLGLGCLFNSRVPHPSLSDVPKPSGFFFLPLLQSGGDGMCYTPFLVQLSQTV